MAKINITGGRDRFWMLCGDCKADGAAFSITEVVELAQHHLSTQHANSTRTHRIEMDADHLVTHTNAAHMAGEADAEGNL